MFLCLLNHEFFFPNIVGGGGGVFVGGRNCGAAASPGMCCVLGLGNALSGKIVNHVD